MTREEMKEIVEQVFDERARVDAVTHGVHHAWIEARIEKEKAVKDLYLKVGVAVAQWSVLGLLGLLVNYVVSHWRGGGV